MNITISPELQVAIQEKADAMKTDPEVAVEILLWMGLAAQNRREAEIAEMVDRLRKPDNPITSQELARTIFGVEIVAAREMGIARFARPVKVKPQP